MEVNTLQTSSTTSGGARPDRPVLVELRRVALMEAAAIEAYLKGKIDRAALDRELRRAGMNRERLPRV